LERVQQAKILFDEVREIALNNWDNPAYFPPLGEDGPVDPFNDKDKAQILGNLRSRKFRHNPNLERFQLYTGSQRFRAAVAVGVVGSFGLLGVCSPKTPSYMQQGRIPHYTQVFSPPLLEAVLNPPSFQLAVAWCNRRCECQSDDEGWDTLQEVSDKLDLPVCFMDSMKGYKDRQLGRTGNTGTAAGSGQNPPMLCEGFIASANPREELNNELLSHLHSGHDSGN
jgi:hypothetical protein